MTLKDATKLVFHSQTLLILPALLFLWYAYDINSGNNITESDLIPHSGQLVNLDTVNANPKTELGYRGLTANYFRFKINSEPNTMFFMVTGPRYSNYHVVTSRLAIGDTVTIFTSPQVSARFTNRHKRIEKLKKGNDVIVNYKSLYTRKNHFGLYINLIISLFFFILYGVKIRRRYYTSV